MYFFTADEHYGHDKILEYCNRPFATTKEMDNEIIRRHNEVVGPEDTVVHIGDFAFCKDRPDAERRYISRLNGQHVFLNGSHDWWLCGKGKAPDVYTVTIEKQLIVCCHYPMRSWPLSHHKTSWHLYGHEHGRLDPIGLSLDVGVDCHDFYPVSFKRLQKIFEGKRKEP
jgi:calcineurin-like phosphoesterase family protein